MNQIYYRQKETNQVFVYESVEDKEKFGPEGLVKMTDAQVQKHLNSMSPEMSEEEKYAALGAQLSHPVTGSDRLFLDALAEQHSGNEEKAKELFSAAILRRTKIVDDFDK